jgi:beta-lactamase class A
MRKLLKYSVGLAIIVGLGVLVASSSLSRATSSAIDFVHDKTGESAVAKTAQSSKASTLESDLENIIAANTNSEVSVTAIDLDNNQTYNAGESSTVFKAASTTKVLAAVDYLHEVEQGNATLTQTLDGTTAQQLMKQMIEASDNAAWASINDYLGDKQQDYAESIGLSSFTGGDYNTMTSGDEASLLAQLYRGSLLNKSHTALLLNYMANTDSHDLIEAGLPVGATSYHKYGTLWSNLHDAAIVNYQGHQFVLVIFTKGSGDSVVDYSARTALIQTLSRTVVTELAALD